MSGRPARRRPTGRLAVRQLKSGESAWYAKTRVQGRRPVDNTHRLGLVWEKRGGRPRPGYLTRRMAEDALADLLDAEARRVADGFYDRPPMPTFADVADAWIRGKSRAVVNSTWTDYDRVLRRHLIPAFGPRRVDEIDSHDVADWKEQAVEEGMSARQVVRCLMVCGQVFTHAMRHHRLSRNPSAGKLVPRPSTRYDTSRFHVLSSVQVRAVAEAMASEHGRAAVLIAAWTGVRPPGELTELRWRDVAWEVERLHVRRSYGSVNGIKSTKGGRGRSVPMTPELVGLLDGLSKREHSTGPDDFVLVDELGGRVAAHRLRARFYEAVEAVGLGHLREADPPLRLYDLRHTFCSHAVKVAPLSDVQAWAGHADVKTTMRYVHHMPSRRDGELLAAAFAGDDGDPRTPAGAPNGDGSGVAGQN